MNKYLRLNDARHTYVRDLDDCSRGSMSGCSTGSARCRSAAPWCQAPAPRCPGQTAAAESPRGTPFMLTIKLGNLTTATQRIPTDDK